MRLFYLESFFDKHYGTGICLLILAFERFVNVCLSGSKEQKLSSSNRLKMYVSATVVIITMFGADMFNRYQTEDWVCDEGVSLTTTAPPPPIVKEAICYTR